MGVPIPFSRAYVLLLLAIPAVWLLGRALTHAITGDRALRAVLPLGMTLCLWVLGIHVASLASGTLFVGLPAGTLVLAATGVAAERARREALGSDVPTGRHPSPWMWISMLATAALLAPAAFHFWFHDELLVTGHLSTAAQMQNGIYPPRNLSFPDLPLRYHYGFDLVTACLTALCHVQVDRAIDLASMGLWSLSWCLLWVLGERLLGRSRAWLTPLLVLFAGGVPLGCEPPETSVVTWVLILCRVGKRFSTNAPVVSYFFQHPWALGIPVAVTAVLLLTEREPRSVQARLLALGLVLAALSLSELVLFVGVLPAIGVAEVWYEGRLELRRAAGMLGTTLVAVGMARLLGGFFVAVPGAHPPGLTLHAGFTNDAASTLVWNAKTFGLLPLLGVAGFVVLRRAALLFGALALGSLVVVNAVRFTGSEDIMKFATLGSIGLAVLAGAALGRLIPPSGPASTRSLTRLVAAALLTLSIGAHGGAYLLLYARNGDDIIPALRARPEELSPADVAAVTFVRQQARAGEMVFRNASKMHGYAQWGGLPQPWLSWTATAFGLPPARLTARNALLQHLPAEPEPYRAQGFRWFVLDATDTALSQAADGWIARGDARLAATFGELRVVALSP